MGVSRRTVSAVVGLVVIVLVGLVGVLEKGGHPAADGAPSAAPTTLHDHVASSTTGIASGSSTAPGGLAWIDAAALPAQAREVLDEIDHGGPYEYPGKDGSVFGNYEGHLPHESSGYYHEYTVDTPGAATRGTRRIITGRDGELYWTADHYNSFQRIRR